MSRIRTIKPEAFESEDLASVSVTAALTFFGLLTQADDSGRFRNNAAIITGRLWALRPEHTATDVEEDLRQLAETGLICRYTSCDGRTWLHIVTWDRHQKINRPSESRLPRCPAHQTAQHCGRCRSPRCPTAGTGSAPQATGDSVSPHGEITRPVSPDFAPEPDRAETPVRSTPHPEETPDAPADPEVALMEETAGQRSFRKASRSAHGALGEGSLPGSRILDPGSVPMGRPAPAPAAPSATDLVAEYAADCTRRPPRDVLGQLTKQVGGLLNEGFEPTVLRQAMDRLRAKSLHPRTLPSLVNEIVNAPTKTGSGTASGPGAHTPYFNQDPPMGASGIPLERLSG